MIDAANLTTNAAHVAELQTIARLRIGELANDLKQLFDAGAITPDVAYHCGARLGWIEEHATRVQVVETGWSA